jgi:hypothetical protein
VPEKINLNFFKNNIHILRVRWRIIKQKQNLKWNVLFPAISHNFRLEILGKPS